MSRAFASLSGSYNVRARESGQVRRSERVKGHPMRCLVHFLDETKRFFEIDAKARGSDLLREVFESLGLIETDFFGLQIQNRWLEPQKRIRKQLKSSPNLNFHFRVKFFVSETQKLLEEFTRFQYFLQIRRDVVSGKLKASDHVLCLLASHVLQSELGDFSPEEHSQPYAHALPLAPPSVQTKEFNRKAEELHRSHVGLTPADSELLYLEMAFKSLEKYGKEIHHAKDCHSRDIVLGVSGAGLSVWEESSEHVVNEFLWAKIVKISFKRKNFFLQLRRDLNERFDHVLVFTLPSYRACKGLWKACVEQHTFFRLSEPKPMTKKFFFFFSLGSKFRYSGKTEFQTLEENRKRLTRAERTFVRTRSSRFTRQTVPIPTTNHIQNLMQTSHQNSQSANGLTPPPRGVTSRVSESSESRPKSAWTDRSNSSQSLVAFSPAHPSEPLPFIDTPLDSNHVTKNPLSRSLSSSDTDTCSPQHVTTIHICADATGRFGFNVKGGSDQKCPVLVSRVAPNTPAHVAGLKEGDQLIQIDRKEVNEMTHAQIVQLIRLRGKHVTCSELVLQIRPNVEEPVFQYIPQDVSPSSANSALQESLLLLREQLDSGSLCLQFEQLQRKKSGEAMRSARLEENLHKNRYRDISPYDSTRVVLKDTPSGDYINASFVEMEVPLPRGLNRYIATQGPLKDTCSDFWTMVWQQKSPLVVMVTPLEEKGRKKCFKYWPEVREPEMNIFEMFKVKMVAEHVSEAVVERSFLLHNDEEEHALTHLQYLAWPDHGVPEDPKHFLELIERVRLEREKFPQSHFVVHCSAGIGRTGVLVLMETGLNLIETATPLYPLELVERMREQRAMLIQTQQQFKFVCEALIRQSLVT